MLEVRYRLDRTKEPEILKSNVKNLSNRHLHSLTVSRMADEVSLQVTHENTYDILANASNKSWAACGGKLQHFVENHIMKEVKVHEFYSYVLVY